MAIPKDLTSKYFPGLEDQHVVGLVGLGYSVTDFTIAVNTAQTNVQVVASPPNVSGVPSPVAVHSLGRPPSAVIPLLLTAPLGANDAGIGWGIQFQYVTADNSAVFIRANTHTGTSPAGASVRLVALR